LQRIQNMKPYTMSWSSVLDYFTLEDFHEIARCCSCAESGDTVHYGYSMNWPTEVFGMSLLDFMEDARWSGGAPKQACEEIMAASLGAEVRDMAEATGQDKLLACLLFDTPLNLVEYHLCHEHQDAWVAHFGRKAAESAWPLEREECSAPSQRTGCKIGRANLGYQLGKSSMHLACPLLRTSISLSLSWTYDPDVNFSAAEQEGPSPVDAKKLEKFLKTVGKKKGKRK